MAIASGARLTPSRLNTRVFTVMSSAALTLTTSDQTVPGSVLNLATTNPNQSWVCNWAGDWDLTTAGAGLGVLTLVVDGVPVVAPVCTWRPSNVAAGARETEGQTVSGVFATPGNHSFRLFAQFSSGGAARLNQGHTAYTLTLFP